MPEIKQSHRKGIWNDDPNQKPKSPWEIAHMDWVTALPAGGDKVYNACLVSVDRYRKTPMFLPFHKDDTDMDTAIIIWK
ncbi:hypothetical protein O181_109483 [Austropuccinia psidii MF-1]|uniref:Uncharacterized protein n=1 Tax=Austropuccinia psidii MF-1 TaxID=1389203 RepID=A0A9Q3JUU9_9BASI|nr:hypothetical protein [Austropuccinia psidii MF-1]